MKKIWLTYIIIGLSVLSSATTCTEAEYRDKCNSIVLLAKRDIEKAQQLANTNGIFSLGRSSGNDTLASEIDSVLSDIGIRGYWAYSSDKTYKLPRIAYNDLQYYNGESNFPHIVSVSRRIGVPMNPMWKVLTDKTMSIEDLIGILTDFCKPRSVYSDFTALELTKKQIQNIGIRSVRKYLRHKGRSFITRNGVNPCLECMQELNTALNAPRFNGLNEWLEKMGLTVRLDTTGMLSESDVMKLKESILNADKDMTDSDKWMLQLCLGIDGFNSFVKEFNKDSDDVE